MLRSGLRAALWVVTVGVDATFAVSSNAQDVVLEQMYGSGVHSYFSGNAPQAVSDLTLAINAGTTDPRAFYFRGLAALRMGMGGNAQQDFNRGAELEAKALDRFYPVSRSLERVQGSDRIALERHRALARAAAYQEKLKREQVRYERLRRAEESVLRAPPPALETPAGKVPAAVTTDTAESTDDPFAKPAKESVEESVEAPAGDASEADPFAGGDATTDETPATEDKAPADTAEEDPFGGAAAEDPAEKEMPSDDNPTAGDEDPFGAGGADASDDKKPETEEKTTEEEKPAGKEGASAEEDPFADDKGAAKDEGATEADDKKPEKKPADEEDPFGT